MDNAERAARAEEALMFVDEGDNEQRISDLLANLMHLAKQDEIDFDVCLSLGTMHFEAEIDEEANG